MPRIRILTILCFAAIYLIWGSTFLAIRIAVATVPPLFAAAVRFLIAGAMLYAWARMRGGVKPTGVQWRNLAILSTFLFLISYGSVFWAEQSLPSGVVSVLVAMIPVWTALLQIGVLRKEPLRWPLAVSILLGLGGVTVLAFDPVSRLNLVAAITVVAGAISWSIGTVLSKILTVPKSMPVNSGAQMLLGGLMLLFCSGLAGEWHPAPVISMRAGLAILYLAVAGSVVAYTAYVWLLDRMRPTVVTSYAYVNPVVALLLGHWLAGEGLGLRTVLGAAMVLLSVVVVMVVRD
jgi:drug/metabolite transporter (DMT)-like permease